MICIVCYKNYLSSLVSCPSCGRTIEQQIIYIKSNLKKDEKTIDHLLEKKAS